jgi:hypothetical protein
VRLSDKSVVVIPEPIVPLQRQFDQFRSEQPRRSKIPEGLWQGAVELARRHGLYAVAHPLRLDYVGLKRRLEAVSKIGGEKKNKKAAPGFVELIAAHPAAAECVIEFESKSGGKMRIQWKGSGWSVVSAALARRSDPPDPCSRPAACRLALYRFPSVPLQYRGTDVYTKIKTPSLGYEQPVGEHLKYLVWAHDRPVACLAWSSAPRHLASRDHYIGWDAAARRSRIRFIAYDTRFLILPWVRVEHLAPSLFTGSRCADGILDMRSGCEGVTHSFRTGF